MFTSTEFAQILDNYFPLIQLFCSDLSIKAASQTHSDPIGFHHNITKIV